MALPGDPLWNFARRSMSTPEERIERELSLLTKAIEGLESRIVGVETRLEEIQGATKRMDTHIDFITRTYNYLRLPLTIMAGFANRLAPLLGSEQGNRRSSLPAIEDQRTADVTHL
jgi:hypothetical protein